MQTVRARKNLQATKLKFDIISYKHKQVKWVAQQRVHIRTKRTSTTTPTANTSTTLAATSSLRTQRRAEASALKTTKTRSLFPTSLSVFDAEVQTSFNDPEWPQMWYLVGFFSFVFLLPHFFVVIVVAVSIKKDVQFVKKAAQSCISPWHNNNNNMHLCLCVKNALPPAVMSKVYSLFCCVMRVLLHLT